MTMKNLLITSIVAVLLAACGDKGDVPASVQRSDSDRVKFYVEHEAERKAKLKDCHDRAINPNVNTDESAECRAAGNAVDEAALKRAPAPATKQYKKF